MKDQDRYELEQLKWRQRRLEDELNRFGRQLQDFEARLSQAAEPAPSVAAAPPPEPHPTPRFEPAPPHAVPPPLPPIIPAPQPEYLYASEQALEPAFPPTEREFEPAPAAAVPPMEPRSFELRLGTFWFVRIGIVLLLTAMAFLGNYAYQNFIFKMGAPGKVTMMYLGSALLLGAGAWLQRRQAKETLRNYAQVLFAGGLAAVYFTTYAAHHIERLRVIQSPVLDGALLLAWAGFIVWIADRRKSELLAMFALGLAYYTSVITRTGSFTLYSNLVLTAASVFFLWRNRWAMLSFISLPATYAGYGFWRFFANEGWRFPSPEEGLLFSAAFLGAYWIVFTAAVFLARQESFRGANRATFLTANNGAAFSLFLLTMAQMQTGGLWKVCLIFGAVLIGLSVLSRRLLPEDPLVENSYLTQGLVLVTLGFIAKFSGMNLALLLAAESVILLVLGIRLQRRLLRAGAYVASLLAVAWLLDSLIITDRGTIYLGIGVAVALLTNSLLVDRLCSYEPAPVRPRVAFFTALLLVCLASLTWTHADRADLAPLFLAEGLLLTFSIYLLRVREVSFFAQALLLMAHLAWLGNALASQAPWEPWWQPAFLAAGTAALLHWWQRQQQIPVSAHVSRLLQAGPALGLVVLLFTWMFPHFDPGGRGYTLLAATAALLAGLTVYSAATRSAMLAGMSQLLVLPLLVAFASHAVVGRAPWYWVLPAPAVFLLLGAGAVEWLKRQQLAPVRHQVIAAIAAVYGWVTVALLVAIVGIYVPAEHRPWTYALLGLAAFVWAGWRNGELLAHSGVFAACAVGVYVFALSDSVWTNLPNLGAILLLLIQQRAARRLPDRYALDSRVHVTVIGIGSLCLWLFVSRYVQQQASGFLLTASWSGLALILFTLGIVLRERTYRWLGLAVLGCALGRVVLFDVWKLHTLYRILSFMALGLVLLVLGYIYNRFQEKIRELL